MKLTAKRQYLHQAITSLAWEVSRDKELESEIIEFCIKNAKMPKKNTIESHKQVLKGELKKYFYENFKREKVLMEDSKTIKTGFTHLKTNKWFIGGIELKFKNEDRRIISDELGREQMEFEKRRQEQHEKEMETISSKLDSMHENLQKDLAELNNQPKAQRNEARETEVDKDDNLRTMQ